MYGPKHYCRTIQYLGHRDSSYSTYLPDSDEHNYQAETRFIRWGELLNPGGHEMMVQTQKFYVADGFTKSSTPIQIDEIPPKTFGQINVESRPIAVLRVGEIPASMAKETPEPGNMREKHQIWISLTIISCLAIISLALSSYAILRNKRNARITPNKMEPKA